jgi:hypothetical protein
MMRPAFAFLLLPMLPIGCKSSTPPPKQESAPPPPTNRPPPPEGPTRTDFKTIAGKLVQECVGGGWISKWRSTAKDVDQARPRIHLVGFEDKTQQNLDPEYLNSELEKRMRMSGVFDMVAEGAELDFIGQGKLLRLAERNARGDRISVYTATLDLIDPQTKQKAYSCEATVKGEM